MAIILTKETTLKSQQEELNGESRLLEKISGKLMITGGALLIGGLILKIFWASADAIYILGGLLLFIGFGQTVKRKSNTNDINRMEAGGRGENMVLNEIKKKLNDSYYVLNDCTIKGISGRKAQNDHLIISEFGIFVIETKYYVGKLEGLATDRNIQQTKTTREGREEKIQLSNPVTQNDYHIEILKELLKEKKIEIPDSMIKSIIIFAHRKSEVNIFGVNNVSTYVGKIFDSIDFIRDTRSSELIGREKIIELLKVLIKDFDEKQLP